MGVIPMPPQGGTEVQVGGQDIPLIVFCNAIYNDPFYIDLGKPGFFFHSADKVFTKKLPEGFQDVGPVNPRRIGPFIPQKRPGDALLEFFDPDTKKLYRVWIQVRPTCTANPRSDPA